MIPYLRERNRIIPKMDSFWLGFSKELGRCVEMGYFSAGGESGLVSPIEGGVAVEVQRGWFVG
jgi:hypothetical protein